MIHAVSEKIEETNRTEPFLFRVAVGYEIGKGKEILRIVKNADTNMYNNKSQIKENEK